MRIRSAKATYAQSPLLLQARERRARSAGSRPSSVPESRRARHATCRRAAPRPRPREARRRRDPRPRARAALRHVSLAHRAERADQVQLGALAGGPFRSGREALSASRAAAAAPRKSPARARSQRRGTARERADGRFTPAFFFHFRPECSGGDKKIANFDKWAPVSVRHRAESRMRLRVPVASSAQAGPLLSSMFWRYTRSKGHPPRAQSPARSRAESAADTRHRQAFPLWTSWETSRWCC